MTTIFNLYLQNNYGMFPQNFTNHNGLLDDEGALVVGFVDNFSINDSTRIVIGSDVISTYQDLMDNQINRNIDNEALGLEGPCIQLFQLPKWSSPGYIGLISASSTAIPNAGVLKGTLGATTAGHIDWTADNDAALFDSNIVWHNLFCADTTNHSVFAYCVNKATTDLACQRYDIGTSSRYTLVYENTYFYHPLSSCYTDPEGEGGVVVGTSDAGGTDLPEDIVWVPFSHDDASFGSPVSIAPNVVAAEGDFVENVELVYDYYNSNIACMIAWWDETESALVFELNVSSNGGTTWSKQVITTGGTGDFVGSVSGEAESHIQMISGLEGGLIIGYTALNADGYARPYVHECTADAYGNDYTIGAAKECGFAFGKYDSLTNMIGPMFFRAPAEFQARIDPIGLVYIGYQIDEGTQHSATRPQESAKSIAMAIERLDEIAFPATTSSFSTDEAGENEYVVTINIIGDNTIRQDYYANGFIGDETNKFVEAFDTYGTSIRVRSYDPKDGIYIGGRTAYDSPLEYTAKVFFDAKNWTSPTPDLGADDFESYINRDLRKIYFDPSFYMEVLGNDSKSSASQLTVWTVESDGYTYEVRQMIPRFINGQIIYWEANCYNVGNFDVWSRGGGF